MKLTKQDKRKRVFQKMVIPFVRLWMFTDVRRKYVYDETFDRKRDEPYVLLANHTFVFDVIDVVLKLKNQPFIVANQNLFTKQPLKFLLEKIAYAIPKSKGASDLRTARDLIGAVKRGHPICIFPEGNTTFNGETTYVEESTMKLIKKLKIDVVVCKVEGGYLSKPRWATSKRKNRVCKMTYKVVISKEEIVNMSLEEINKKVNDEMYNDDYVYQRKVMIPHPSKKAAEGLENILYICPECNSVGTIETKNDEVSCTHCNTVGKVNEYGFIEGFKYDNTVDWDHFQRDFDLKLRDVAFESPGKIYLVNDELLSRVYLGEINIKSENSLFQVTGDFVKDFPINQIKNPLVTLRRNFNLNYEGEHYLIKIDKYVSSFLRVSQKKY